MGTNSPKFRDFFITVNESAPSYQNALEITKELNFKMYAYIVHDKDKIVNEETGEEETKRIHKHIVVELKNPISFKSMQSKFEGAHIEIPRYKKSAYQYLIHNRPNARDKYQYAFEEIITNSPQELKFIIESEDFELFKENMFLEYIIDGTTTTFRFIQRFGMNAYKQYWATYNVIVQLSITGEDQELMDRLKEIKEEREKNEELL